MCQKLEPKLQLLTAIIETILRFYSWECNLAKPLYMMKSCDKGSGKLPLIVNWMCWSTLQELRVVPLLQCPWSPWWWWWPGYERETVPSDYHICHNQTHWTISRSVVRITRETTAPSLSSLISLDDVHYVDPVSLVSVHLHLLHPGLIILVTAGQCCDWIICNRIKLSSIVIMYP